MTNTSLHTAAEPAVRAAVKNKLSYGNDTIIAFFFEANKNKDNVIIALASSKNYLVNSGINLTTNGIFCSK